MKQNFDNSKSADRNYVGKILHGNYSSDLHQYISDNIRRFTSFEKTHTPVISYMAAWCNNKDDMWYEFVGKRFADLMGCAPGEVSENFRQRIQEQRVYNYLIQDNSHIATTTMTQSDIIGSRIDLRQEGEREGVTEGVYKIVLSNGSVVWLKDQATVKSFEKDKIHVSSGFLTIVTKEMEAEEELLQNQQILENNTRELLEAKKKEEKNAARLSSALKQIEIAREEAEKANKAKSEFLAVISHEIRNPMHGIISTCNLIMTDEFSRQRNEYLGIIKNSAVSLLELINDILDFSKIEAGKLDFHETNFNLRDLVEDVSDIIHELTSRKKLELVVDINPEIPEELVSDPMRLRQVLINLAFNALKFTERGEIIILVEPSFLEKSEIEIVFSVKDTGIGIAQEHVDNLFDSFSQVNNPVSREHGGTGLGLAICRQIVEMMGGSIWVESMPGSGSTFSFKVPFKYAEAEQEEMPAADETFKNYSVLVAEENSSSRAAVERLLAAWGFDVSTCSSAHQVIERVNQKNISGKFDLVIMDMGIKGLDNAAVCSRLQSLADDTSHFIATHSAGGENGIGQAMEIGIDKIVVKPVKKTILLETIKKCFGYAVQPEIIKNESTPVDENISEGCILFVDDNAVNRKIGMQMLENAGIDADTARNGIEAVEKIQKKTYTTMLIDIQMPYLDGIEASRIIRQKFTMDQLPIIAMSAYSRSTKWKECQAAGINDYILKPLESDAVLKVVNDSMVCGKKVEIDGSAEQHYKDIEQPDFDSINSEHAEIKNRDFKKRELERVESDNSGSENSGIQIGDNENGDLRDLPGINLKEGIKRLGGVKDVFVTLLHDFCEEYISFRKRIQLFVDKGEYQDAATLAHSIKGAAGNLSAGVLYEQAKKLEKACWDRDEAAVARLLDSVQSAFDQVLSSSELLNKEIPLDMVQKKEEKSESEIDVNPDDLLIKMELLKKSLMKFDPVASESLAREIKSLTEPSADREMDKLLKEVRNYQFDAALTLLGIIMEGLQEK